MHLLVRIARELLKRAVIAGGAFALTLAFFLVLPLMQTISRPPRADLLVQSIATAQVPPPPAPPEEKPEEEEQEEQEPPELEEEAPPMDLAQLELALNQSLSGDWLGGDFGISISAGRSRAEEVDALFALSDLDQPPRIIHQPGPVMDARLRRKAPGSVYVIFIVNREGRVENPIARDSSDPIFERPAIAAVTKWKFEPGKRKGEPVQFRMAVPITFPKGQ